MQTEDGAEGLLGVGRSEIYGRTELGLGPSSKPQMSTMGLGS